VDGDDGKGEFTSLTSLPRLDLGGSKRENRWKEGKRRGMEKGKWRGKEAYGDIFAPSFFV